MTQEFDFIVVGGGSSGAVIAARLSEDPTCHVALVEAGDRPPEHELMPVACASLQNDPATDWMYTADPGRVWPGSTGSQNAGSERQNARRLVRYQLYGIRKGSPGRLRCVV